MSKQNPRPNGLEIAIIGISCNFPESPDYRSYWNNIKMGRNLIKTFTDEELLEQGIPEKILSNPLYVKSEAVLSGKNMFDQGFFGYTINEASLMDPQIRLFHQTVWSSLEDAGYASKTDKLKIGLFAGASSNDPWKFYTYKRRQLENIDPFFAEIITKRNFLSTLVSYKLNLRGPSIFVDTACSSSLVAVHQACISLLTRECSIAIAGGISLKSQLEKGYLYKEGMVRSRDGQCRAFDDSASGTAVGEGTAVVVLKKLNQAIEDRDHIYAIIKGSSVNNDGSNKVGFTAPSVKGQKDCIKRAYEIGAVDPCTIGYIETHGTGTPLGDPIEIRALNEAFDIKNLSGSCAIGSVKTNMGHLDAAAGIAGLVKTALCIKNGQIPVSLHYQNANPEIDFGNGPFYVNTSLKNWPEEKNHIRRAGVSSFGIGGTNAHILLEQSPDGFSEVSKNIPRIIVLSAKTEISLRIQMERLQDLLNEEEITSIDRIAYTFHVGRKHFKYRKFWVCNSVKDLKTQLSLSIKNDKKSLLPRISKPSVIFMFPGQGSQYLNMGKELYLNVSDFKREMDLGFDLLFEYTNIDFKSIIFPTDNFTDSTNQTRFTQPLLFLLEYSLARYLISLGINPSYTIGHSLGEYVSACLNGVFSLRDALFLVSKRGELMNRLPHGTMISVAINYRDALEYCNEAIAIAAVNGPEQTVLSGTLEAIEELILKFKKNDIPNIRIPTSHAFHSPMQDPILDDFRKELEKITFNDVVPNFVSCVTGKLITKKEALSIDYWTKHLRETVHFAKGMEYLLNTDKQLVFLEVGCGQTLSNLLKQINQKRNASKVFKLMRSGKESIGDLLVLFQTFGEMWENGIEFNWDALYKEEDIVKMSLPTYAFEQNKYVTEVPTYYNKSLFEKTEIEELFDPVIPSLDQYKKKEETFSIINSKSVERPDLNTSFVPASTEMEIRLAKMFEEFFSVQRIGILDNFFELGGDSLKAMSIVRKIKNELSLDINLKLFFANPNIKKLSVELERRILIDKKVNDSIKTLNENDTIDLDDSEHFSI